MLSFSYRTQSLILCAWILVVIFLFRFVPDRQIAATFAGVGFVLWPSLFLMSEFAKYPRIAKLHTIILAVFLLFCAVPILLLRVMNWGVPFDQLGILGISGNFIHKTSNYIYIVMLLSAIYQYFRSKSGTK